eukprot:TRINITY_DN363_c0_g1_i1.p1 TRINITY_DN363_c0_g1~~TRINITY_DN363_c0_g1_i1.p1  ORF type:complete len:376 (+),score=95.26 TRINITY_DN363_c0_g1_i1:151-1278(+)
MEASTPDDAVTAATKLGYPVVVKLLSHTITHKSDVGGVILGVQSEHDVRVAFETIKKNLAKHHAADWQVHFKGVTVQPMISLTDGCEVLLGGFTDTQIGPAVVFGSGGKFVEVFKDTAIGLPPFNSTTADLLMRQTKVYKALQGARGNQVNIDTLSQIIVAFGDMLANHPLIKECDINPVIASSKSIIAVDARVVLWPSTHDMLHVPKVVCPMYPVQLVSQATFPGGRVVTIRPLRPEDADAWQRWQAAQGVCDVGHARVVAVTNASGTAISVGAFDDAGAIVAETRLLKQTRTSCACSLVVAPTAVATIPPLLEHSCRVAKCQFSCSHIFVVVRTTAGAQAGSQGVAKTVVACGFAETNASALPEYIVFHKALV